MLILMRNGALATNQPQPLPLDPIARILGQAFVAACDTLSAPNDARLREIVFLFVTRLKSMSVPPERVLIAIKSAISSFGDGRPPSLAQSLTATGDPSRLRTYRRVFQWLLEAYFE
ncbi:MAG TPA: hypothetical protein VGM82_10385 [Gemmatimonadaceae bacterium]